MKIKKGDLVEFIYVDDINRRALIKALDDTLQSGFKGIVLVSSSKHHSEGEINSWITESNDFWIVNVL